LKQNRNSVDKVTVRYLNHASFLITYRKTSLLIDPFFSGEFFWQDHLEIQLSKPEITMEDIPRIDAILCTHIHGDHFDRDFVFKLVRRDNCLLIAPFDVIELCVKNGFKRKGCLIASAKKSVQISDMSVVPLPNKGSEHEPVCSRLSFVIECGGKKVFHSGDSHGYSETWDGYRRKINLACLWCVKITEIIEQLQPDSVFIHHFEKFSPGDFSCNINVLQMLDTLKKRFSTVNFYNPLEEDTVVL